MQISSQISYPRLIDKENVRNTKKGGGVFPVSQFLYKLYREYLWDSSQNS